MSHAFLDMQETTKNILEKTFCFILSLFCPISFCVKTRINLSFERWIFFVNEIMLGIYKTEHFILIKKCAYSFLESYPLLAKKWKKKETNVAFYNSLLHLYLFDGDLLRFLNQQKILMPNNTSTYFKKKKIHLSPREIFQVKI